MLSWVLFYWGTHEASRVDWSCYGGECSTDDWQAGGPLLGFFADFAFTFISALTLGRCAFGLAFVILGTANGTGWWDAITDYGVPEDSVRAWIIGAYSVAAVGAVLFLWGADFSIRRLGLVYRFSGRKAAIGRAHGLAGGIVTGPGTLSFIDETGLRHDVATRIESDWLKRPVTVFYDPGRPDDPDLIRVGLPVQPWSESRQEAELRSLRELLPLSEGAAKKHWGDTKAKTSTAKSKAGNKTKGGPDSLPGQLERLAGCVKPGICRIRSSRPPSESS